MNNTGCKNWYDNTCRFLRDTFGDDYKLVAALLSACSPQVRLKTSWKWSMQIYHQYMSGKQPDLSMVTRCHRNNIRRALAGEELSGPKVKNFYKNLVGDLDAVTIDTWMLRLFKWYDRYNHSPTENQYNRLARSFKRLAYNLGLFPAQLQAILWTKYREKHGYSSIDYISAGSDDRQYTFADLF